MLCSFFLFKIAFKGTRKSRCVSTVFYGNSANCSRAYVNSLLTFPWPVPKDNKFYSAISVHVIL